MRVYLTDMEGKEHELTATEEWSVMEIIREGGIPILAQCGGSCACATCHVYVAPEWTETVGKPSQMEEDMLDFAFEVRPSSRLSCQIKVVPALDGLVVATPAKQG